MSKQSRFQPKYQFIVFALLIAATALVARAHITPTPVPLPQDQNIKPRIEVTFVLDTTGSMSGLIEGAKQKIWSIANQMVSADPAPEIRIGLIGYRDRGDQYVTKITDLSGDIDAVYGQLRAFRADGGGDTPESVNQALHEAVTKLSWSQDPGVYRVIFLVGDAPPKMNYADDVRYAETARLAKKKGIVLNTIQCGELASTKQVWIQIAQAGLGEYVALHQDGQMVAMSTPVDEDLSKLNRELADTVVAYGAVEEQEELKTKIKNSLSASKEAVASRLSFMDKLGKRANSGRKDLVQAVEDGDVVSSNLPAASLPEEMKEMDSDERESYVREKSKKRQEIQEKISKLSEERDAYIETELEKQKAEGKADGFDQKVLGLIRDQAAEKDIHLE